MDQVVEVKAQKSYAFNQEQTDHLSEPLFLGNGVNVQRYDQVKYPNIDGMTAKQKSFFWTPEEVDGSKDRVQFTQLPDNEKHIFISNLKYQILLDSVQGRSPSSILLPLASLPEVEAFIDVWTFVESIHSTSYTHIIRNVFPEPGPIFDDIMVNEAILERASSISKYYDDLHVYSLYYQLLGEGTHTVNGEKITINKQELMKRLYLCMFSVQVLEAVRFYGSFLCSFAFGQHGVMEGNAKIIKLIAR